MSVVDRVHQFRNAIIAGMLLDLIAYRLKAITELFQTFVVSRIEVLR